MPLPKFLEHIVILCFERRYPKQNSVIRLKSRILAPTFYSPPNFYSGYATSLWCNKHLPGQSANIQCFEFFHFGDICLYAYLVA